MSRPLKVWSCSLGRDHSLVAATTKTEAARLLGMSLFAFNQFVSETGNEADIAEATARPGLGFAALSTLGTPPMKRSPPRTLRVAPPPERRIPCPSPARMWSCPRPRPSARQSTPKRLMLGKSAALLRPTTSGRRCRTPSHARTPPEQSHSPVLGVQRSNLNDSEHLPNLGLTSLSGYAAESDYYRGYARGHNVGAEP